MPSLSIKNTLFHAKVVKSIPFLDQNHSKTILFWAAHTYIAYIKEYGPAHRDSYTEFCFLQRLYLVWAKKTLQDSRK